MTGDKFSNLLDSVYMSLKPPKICTREHLKGCTAFELLFMLTDHLNAGYRESRVKKRPRIDAYIHG